MGASGSDLRTEPLAFLEVVVKIVGFLRAFWAGFRNVLGDDAFERYLERHMRTHPDLPPLDRATFFKAEIERRWSGIRRCC